MSQARQQHWQDQDLGRRELYRRNKALQTKLDQLLESVSRYRATQSRYEAFELSLLEGESFQEVIESLTQRLKRDFKLDAVSLTLFDPDGIARELLAQHQHSITNLQLLDNYQTLTAPIREMQAKRLFPGGAIGHLRPILTSDKDAFSIAGFKTAAIQSMAFLPLIREHLLIGYLCLGSLSEQRFSPDLAIDLLSHMASITAVCLENTLSREQLRMLSQIDMLTRVKNRRAFDQALRKEIARAQRQTSSLACLFADLDHFKLVNDTYGHATGDRVLKTVAHAIQDMLRESDTLARIGGEEFTVLLPDTDQDGSADIAERIRYRIASLEIPDDSGKVVKVTTSIGFAYWHPGMLANEEIEDIHRRLMGCADKAVYLAKQDGRNKVREEPYGVLRSNI